MAKPKRRIWRQLTYVVLALSGAVLLSFIAVVFIQTQISHTRWSPEFRGFKGQWDRAVRDDLKNEYGRLVIEPDLKWKIESWTKDGEKILDQGTWSEMDKRTYKLESSGASRTAVISADDPWIMHIDGVEYRRVVK